MVALSREESEVILENHLKVAKSLFGEYITALKKSWRRLIQFHNNSHIEMANELQRVLIKISVQTAHDLEVTCQQLKELRRNLDESRSGDGNPVEDAEEVEEEGMIEISGQTEEAPRPQPPQRLPGASVVAAVPTKEEQQALEPLKTSKHLFDSMIEEPEAPREEAPLPEAARPESRTLRESEKMDDQKSSDAGLPRNDGGPVAPGGSQSNRGIVSNYTGGREANNRPNTPRSSSTVNGSPHLPPVEAPHNPQTVPGSCNALF